MPFFKKIWQSTTGEVVRVATVLIAIVFCTQFARAQHFGIEQKSDSLWLLTLSTDSGFVTSTWPLPYPVYRFATGDIDGDGSTDAVVGVFKASRYFTTASRRVFIFKNFEGDIRPLWLGSRLGGELIDFTVVGNKIRAIEAAQDHYVVSDYAWKGFGMGFETKIASCNSIDECYNYLGIIKQ